MPPGRRPRCPLGTLILSALGSLGILTLLGLSLLRDGTPTREVGIGTGDRGSDSQSDSVLGGGESGLGGGSTSPGIVIRRLRLLSLLIVPGGLPGPEPVRAPSRRSVMRGPVVASTSVFRPLPRLVCGDLTG
jgi:hypothetical protein